MPIGVVSQYNLKVVKDFTMSITQEFSRNSRLARKQKLATELADQDYELIATLVSLREKSGLSQTEVAEMLGVSQQAVSKFEQMEADPRLSTIRRYAIAIDALVTHSVQSHARKTKGR